MSAPRLDLTGQTFGRLTVLGLASTKNGRRMWQCICACGVVKDVKHDSLRGGLSNSCGCLKRELSAARRRTHGMSRTKEHRALASAIYRCHNPSYPGYPRYGGRGITVCKEFRESFEAFFEEVGPCPSPRHSLDRIDNARGYEPGNVRWATSSEQMQNRRTIKVSGVLVALVAMAKAAFGTNMREAARRVLTELSDECLARWLPTLQPYVRRDAVITVASAVGHARPLKRLKHLYAMGRLRTLSVDERGEEIAWKAQLILRNTGKMGHRSMYGLGSLGAPTKAGSSRTL